MAVTRTVNQSAPDLQFVEKVFDLSKEYHVMLAWGTVKLGMSSSMLLINLILHIKYVDYIK